MYKYIVALFLADETEPFSIIEPFNNSLCQSSALLSSVKCSYYPETRSMVALFFS